MILSNYFWFFKKAVPDRICENIKKYGLSQQPQVAITGDEKGNVPKTEEEFKQLHKQRNSDIVWLDEPWIYREIHPYVHTANKLAGWNFEWDFTESCQFTKYKLNQYYDWHSDSWDKTYDQPNTPSHGKVRKLSMTCQLTDGSEYQGGELEFDFRNYDPPQRDEAKHLSKATEILSKGSIIVFPSFLWHRVKPVIKGTRYSLVAWHLGYPFR